MQLVDSVTSSTDSTEKQSRMWEIVAQPRNLSLYSGVSSNRIPNAKAQMSYCLQWQEHVSSFNWNSLRTIFNLWTRGFPFFHPNDLTEVLWEFTIAAIPWKCFHIFSGRGYTTLLGCHQCDSFTLDIYPHKTFLLGFLSINYLLELFGGDCDVWVYFSRSVLNASM